MRARPFTRGHGLAFALALVASSAQPEPLDPRLPQRLHTSPPLGAALTERLDRFGNNRSDVAFPRAPRVAWQTRVSPPILGAPLASAPGTLIVAHGHGRLSELDASGRTVYSLRTGLELAGSPLLLGGGERVVIGRDGSIVAVSPHGRVLAREKLPFGEFEGVLLATPTADGGAVVAAGARLVRLGPRAAPAWWASTSDPLRALFEWRGQTLAVGKNGAVLARAEAGDPEEIANFGASVGGAALLGDRLLAITGGKALVELDLARKTKKVRFADPVLELFDLARDGHLTRLLSRRGTLVALDAADRELSRLALVAAGSAGEALGLALDATGATLAAFAAAPLVHVTAQGDVSTLAGTACPDPLRPTPVRSGLVVATCRSGIVRGLSDRGP